MKSAYLSNIKVFFLRHFPVILFFLSILFIFLTNTVHETYPDEFDDILGGWYMLHGKFLYSGFFTHHNPVGYILSAVIELVSWQSFVRFRLVYAFVLFFYFLWTYLFFKKKFPQKDISFYLFVIGLFAIGATYFWGHMLLADNIAAFLLLPAFGLIVLRSFYREKFLSSDIIVVSILGSLAFLTSATYLYLVGFLYLYMLYLQISFQKTVFFSKEIFKTVVILGVPFVIFFLYLLVTGALVDYYYQNLVFNPKFYIYNYPRPEGGAVNPIRYAIVIANDFYNNFSTLLIGVKDFNFLYPVNMTLAVANIGLIIYLFLQKRFGLAVFIVLILTYANVRTNVLTSKETDYQLSVYIMLTFFNIGFVLKQLYADLENNLTVFPKKILFSFLLLVIGIYTLFCCMYLVKKYNEKTFKKYMGVQALIYDRPQVAPLMNSITEKDDYVWIGPFAFEELFYTNRRTPSKYIILLPEFGKFDHIKNEFMADFDKEKPKVIYFDRRYRIRGYAPEDYAQFFLDYLDKHYILLIDYKEGSSKYVSVNAPTEKLDIETKLFINKQYKDEIIQKLLDQNLIRKESLNEKK